MKYFKKNLKTNAKESKFKHFKQVKNSKLLLLRGGENLPPVEDPDPEVADGNP